VARIAVIVIALTVVGCGSVESTKTTETVEGRRAASPAPPIEVTNQTVDPAAFERFDSENSGEACVAADPKTGEVEEVPCDDLRLYEERGWPAEGAVGTVVATLALSSVPQVQAALVAYPSRDRGTCWMIQVGREDRRDWEPFECIGDRNCPEICLMTAHGDEPRAYGLLGGTVSGEGEEILLDFAEEDTARYALTGPLVPGLSGQRVFLLEIGDRALPRATILKAGKAIAAWPPAWWPPIGAGGSKHTQG
jgi:hypothetical protein